MVQNHLKRIAAPKTWAILRKANVFTTRPNSGAHPHEFGMSLNTLVKEVLGIAQTTKEVKKMIHDKHILVDGKLRHDEKFNVGFMDVVSIPAMKKHFRIVLTAKGKIGYVEIKEAEATQKISLITGKTTIKGGKTQVNLSGGRIIILEKDQYSVGDALLLSLPEQKIVQHIPFGKEVSVIALTGKHIGEHGNIVDFDDKEVTIKNKEGSFKTRRSNIFVVGDKQPLITCSQ